MAAIVTLTTDFGLRDAYVGAVKGALLSVAPGLTVVDLGHEVPPQDILAGAFLLRCAAFEYPPGTVHLAIVDPGVGSDRRPLAVDAAGFRWVGPDNGVLSIALDEPRARTFEITHPDLRRKPLSATFHGRDLFAPAAAHLATGFPVEHVGPPVDDPVALAPMRTRREGDRLFGTVVHVDRFGNLISCIEARDLPPRVALRVAVGGASLVGLVSTYADVEAGQLAALVGSGGLLEIGLRGGSAARRLGLGRGAAVVVESARVSG